jgi:hypothetical protein
VRRPAIALATIIVATLSLSGCDVLAPTRDSDGRILRAVEMPSTEAWVGDCFTFVDNSSLAYATVVPCSDPHTHVVIGRGTLSAQRIAYFNDLQIAVLTACKDRFDLYQTTQELELTPEYIVSDKAEHDGRTVTHYSCLVKDA